MRKKKLLDILYSFKNHIKCEYMFCLFLFILFSLSEWRIVHATPTSVDISPYNAETTAVTIVFNCSSGSI